MKKIILLTAVCIAVLQSTKAQTFDEWFRQKKTQRKYLIQQIAALQVYLNYAKEGYQIIGNGVNTVRHIKEGDFNLHQDFFGSLKRINPAIAKFAKVADIITYQAKIIRSAKQTLAQVKVTQQFTPEEAGHCKDVLEFLLAECLKSAEELTQLLTPGEYEMKDDERLKRINKIYDDVQSKYSFCSSFGDDIRLLIVQRLSEQAQISYSKKLNGFK